MQLQKLSLSIAGLESCVIRLGIRHIWQSQDKCQDAYNLLAPVYDWFTEGFDTAHLQEAKGLLQELTGYQASPNKPVLH